MQALQEDPQSSGVMALVADRAQSFAPTLSASRMLPQNAATSPREDTQTLSRVVLAIATTIVGLMGILTYWIG